MQIRTKQAFELLLEQVDGEGNPRYNNVLRAAIVSAPVVEVLRQAIEHYWDNYEDAKKINEELGLR